MPWKAWIDEKRVAVEVEAEAEAVVEAEVKAGAGAGVAVLLYPRVMVKWTKEEIDTSRGVHRRVARAIDREVGAYRLIGWVSIPK